MKTHSQNAKSVRLLLLSTLATLILSLLIGAMTNLTIDRFVWFQTIKQLTAISFLALFIFWQFQRNTHLSKYRDNVFRLKRVGAMLLLQIVTAFIYVFPEQTKLWQWASALNLLLSGFLYLSIYWQFLLKRFSDAVVVSIISIVFQVLIAYALTVNGSVHKWAQISAVVYVCAIVGTTLLMTIALLRAQHKLSLYSIYEFLPVLLILVCWIEVMAVPATALWWSSLFFQLYLLISVSVELKRINTSASSDWKMFKSGFDLSKNAYFCCDMNGNIRFVNKAYKELIDIPEDAAIQDIHHPLYTHPLSDSVQESLSSDGKWQGETVLVSQKGRVVSVFANMSLIEVNGMSYQQGWLYDMHEKIELKQNESAILEKLERLSFSLMEKQEDERRFFAKELHDEIGQGLTLLKIQLQLPQPDKDLITTVLSELIDKVRNLSLNLRPAILDDMGLSSALIWLSGRQRQFSQLAITDEIDKNLPRLNDKIEISVFRIAQEAFTNIHKYSHADHVYISCQVQGDYLQLFLEDNGVGFDVDAKLNRANKGQSLGLLSIKERAFLVNGLVQINSTPEQGTKIELRVPLQVAEVEQNV